MSVGDPGEQEKFTHSFVGMAVFKPVCTLVHDSEAESFMYTSLRDYPHLSECRCEFSVLQQLEGYR